MTGYHAYAISSFLKKISLRTVIDFSINAKTAISLLGIVSWDADKRTHSQIFLCHQSETLFAIRQWKAIGDCLHKLKLHMCGYKNIIPFPIDAWYQEIIKRVESYKHAV